MREKILVLSSVLFLSLNIYGQLITLGPKEKGDKLFNQFSYSQALEFYQIALEEKEGDAYLTTQIANCYNKLNQPSRSEFWYKKAIASDKSPDPILLYNLAEALCSNERYDEAKEWYQKYLEADNTNAAMVNEKIAAISENRSYSRRSLYEIEKVKFNSEQSDFSPSFYKSGVMFVSSRKGENWVKGSYNWDESAYLDMYYVGENKSKVENDHFSILNSRFHDGPGQFYDSDKKLVFTRSNYQGEGSIKNNEGVTKLQIYFADWNENESKFKIDVPFVHNNKEYSYGHPTISKDGGTLYFISDMPGGYGGTDIYVSYGSGNVWSKPKNLGPEVNTPGNEVFPFLNGNDLFFASNGQGGLGGLDLFRVPLENNLPAGGPENLGAPFNSPKDDFGFITSSDFKTGFFSSNREEESNDDIFQFKLVPPKEITIRGKVVEHPGTDGLSEILVNIKGENQELVQSTTTDNKGEFEIIVPYGQLLSFIPQRNNYVPVGKVEFNTAGNDTDVVLEIPMRKMEGEINFVVNEEKSGKEVLHPIIKLQLKNFTTILPDRSSGNYTVEPDIEYVATVSKVGYYTTRDTFSVDDQELQSLLIRPLKMKKIVVGESIRLDHIYYDVNSANLRKESESELDKVVNFMKDNPGINIELGSHTDARGSSSYNKKLSQRRAESASKYLVDNGVDVVRITPKGYGEDKLINRCKDGTVCSEKEHQENRRTEIKILKGQ